MVNACSNSWQNQEVQKIQAKDASALTPEQVVTMYFQSWNDKEYGAMYMLISDGFKQIEPTASNFEDFRLYMDSFFETEKGISVIEVNQAYMGEKEAGVNYRIEITGKDGLKKEFENAYTLKKKQNGWKLIHPYGEHIDTS
ncbi:hypothetical protein HY487_00495 [Candidatus Woesearchaeota archaeon]|nr:hypothetical protein [Candidatus Woesearchaeota archaeon]